MRLHGRLNCLNSWAFYDALNGTPCAVKSTNSIVGLMSFVQIVGHLDHHPGVQNYSNLTLQT